MDINDFWKMYRLVASTKDINQSSHDPKICRFCGKSEPETWFKNKSHLISELLGENNLFNEFECDSCNAFFSSYETHLSIFFRPYLTMTGTKGKRKVPAFHSRTEDGDEATRTIINANDQNQREIIVQKQEDVNIDDSQKILSITFRKPPHKPYLVYKALVKIGLSLLPTDQVEKYNHVFNWLLNKPSKVDCFITMFTTILTKSRFKEPFAELYFSNQLFRGDDFLPESTLVLGFGNVIAQVFLPLSDTFDYAATDGKVPELNLFPSFILDKNEKRKKFTVNAFDLKEKHSITQDEVLNFKFESRERHVQS